LAQRSDISIRHVKTTPLTFRVLVYNWQISLILKGWCIALHPSVVADAVHMKVR